MQTSTLAVGSLEAMAAAMGPGAVLDLPRDADVVVVATAAAFTGLEQAALAVADVLNRFDVRVEALMIADRASASEPHFVERIAAADLVVLSDGSPLHARAVWRDTPVGAAIDAARTVVAVGSVASVLGAVMIDPRGGAPTTGLGYRSGVALSVPASDEQLERTRSLVGPDVALVVLGPSGMVHHDGSRWRVVGGDVVVTRGHDEATL